MEAKTELALMAIIRPPQKSPVSYSRGYLILYHFFEGCGRPSCLPTGFGLSDRGRRGAVAEGPDLLGDPTPVGGRVEAAQQGVEPKVDALHDHVLSRHVRVGGERAADRAE